MASGDQFDGVVWRHFRLEVPRDWELLQFSRDLEKGRCAFADRYRFRLEINWQRVPGAPDMDRMLHDYQRSLEASGQGPAEPLTAGNWRGLLARGPTPPLWSRFGRYFAETACLVEGVFVWPELRDESCEQRVLASFEPQPDERDGSQRWRAFGLDLCVPAGFALTNCGIQPARACMDFTGPRGGGRYRFQRLGLLKHWLRQPIADWMKAQARDAKNSSSQTKDIAGHRVEILAGASKARGWLLPDGRYEAAAWICPADGRLYHAEHVAPRSAPADARAVYKQLSCCEAFRRTA